MVNSIIIQGGHKVVCQVLNRESFLAKRNSVSNLLNVKAAREGDAEAKSHLVQMAYNDLMPDGKGQDAVIPATASSTTSIAMMQPRQRQRRKRFSR